MIQILRGKYSINTVKLHDTEKHFVDSQLNSVKKEKNSRKLSQTNLDCLNSGFPVTESFFNNV